MTLFDPAGNPVNTMTIETSELIDKHTDPIFYVYKIYEMACVHCDAVINLLDNLGLPFQIINLPKDVAISLNVQTVPQVFFGQYRIGGRQELQLYLNEMGILPLFKKVRKDAQIPFHGSAEAAGLDLYACVQEGKSMVIPPLKRAKVGTGVSVMCPKGTYARIAPRSGLAVKNGIDTLAGVIDRDYRGEIIVCLVNLGDEDFYITKGDRVAQLIFEKIVVHRATVEVDILPDTTRGAGRYGSTGSH